MKILTGDETGLIKYVDTITKTSIPYGSQSRVYGIKKLCWIKINKLFGLVRMNNIIEIWSIRGNEIIKERSYDINISNLMGITAASEDILLCYSSSGQVAILNLNDDVDPIIQTVRSPIETLESCFGLNRYACGGQDNDLQLWDLNEGKVLWSAKNVPHDSVRLAVPIYITSISFLRHNSEHEHDGNLIVTGTAHHHVRLYDIRTKRQPVQSWEPMEFKVTNVRSYFSAGSSPSLQSSSSSSYCSLVSDCSGVLQSIDLLTGKLRTSYPTSGGSIKDIAMTTCGEYFATVSYDRYLRVYEVDKKNERFHMYLKNRLTSCLVISDDDPGKGMRKKKYIDEDDDEEDGDEDGDDVIENYVDSDDNDDGNEDESEDNDDEDEEEDGDDDNESEDNDDDEEDDDEDEDEKEEEIVPSKGKRGSGTQNLRALAKRPIQSSSRPVSSKDKKPKYR